MGVEKKSSLLSPIGLYSKGVNPSRILEIRK